MNESKVRFETYKAGNKDTGSVTTFMRKHQQSMSRGEPIHVPCNGCTACCREPNLFVELTDEEAKRLKSHWDEEDKQWHLDKQENGHCVYLIDDRYTIYSERPKTCRLYDCRFNLLLGIMSDNTPVLNESIKAWKPFRVPTMDDKVTAVAVKFAMLAVGLPTSLLNLGKAATHWRQYVGLARAFVEKAQKEGLPALGDKSLEGKGDE